MFWSFVFQLKDKAKSTAFRTFWLQNNQTKYSYRSYFSIFLLRWDVSKPIENPFIKIKKQQKLGGHRKILIAAAIPTSTYFWLT